LVSLRRYHLACKFHTSGIGKNHRSLTFNLSGGPAIQVSNLLTGFQLLNGSLNTTTQVWSVKSGSIKESPLGSFLYAIDDTGTGPFTLLSFDLTNTAHNLTLASFTSIHYNTGNANIFFGSDIKAGETGNVGALAAVTAVWEASTWAMMILGFACIGFMAYSRRGQQNFRHV
jgi:hypothetical protein